jgi:cyanate permease
MGFGLTMGALISATVLSPLFGGWRNVLFVLGGVSAILGFAWALLGREPVHVRSARVAGSRVPPLKALAEVVKHRSLWLLGLSLTCRMGCMMGITGYLPLYLVGQGWTPASADGALSMFYGVSVLMVVPISILSDRVGSRKRMLYPALLTALIGVGLVSVVKGPLVLVVLVLAATFYDGFMAIILTMTQETRGLGVGYAGMALGMVMSLSGIGAFIAPPVGNGLASISPGLPFVFWASLCVIPLLALRFVPDTGGRIRVADGPGMTRDIE